MNARLSGDESGRDDRILGLGSRQLRPRHRCGPQATIECACQFIGFTREQHPALVDDRHVRTEVTHIGHDMGGQHHDHLFADFGQQVMETYPLLRVQTRRRFIDNDQLGITQQCLRDTEALAHTAGIAAQRFVAYVEEVGLLEKACDNFKPLFLVGQPLQLGEVVEHVPRRDLRINAEFLGQVAQLSAHIVFVLEYIDVAQPCAARISVL